MSDVVGYQLNDETIVRFEYQPPDGFTPAGIDEVIGSIKDAIEPALLGAEVVLNRTKAMRPDEIEVKFGIKVTGEMNWLISKAATDANFEIALTWKQKEQANQ